MKAIILKGDIMSDDDSYFFSSELGGEYIISINKDMRKVISRFESRQVQIKGMINGSKLHILSVKEIK